MTSRSVVRVGDEDSGLDTKITGSDDVFTNFRPTHRVGDNDSDNDTTVTGSDSVFVNFRPIHRVGDEDDDDDTTVTGSDDVFAGNSARSGNIYPEVNMSAPGDPNPTIGNDMSSRYEGTGYAATPGGGMVTTNTEGGPFPVTQPKAEEALSTPRAGCTSPDLGKLSEKYESNGDPGSIGKDKNGGYSYGSYQIASKTGTFGEFLQYTKTQNPAMYEKLTAAGGASAARSGDEKFKEAWRSLKTDPSAVESQKEFMRKTHFDVLANRVKKSSGIDFCAENRCAGLQQALWSTSTHNGAYTNLVATAIKNAGPNASDQEIISAIYDERSKTDIYFSKSTPREQAGIRSRMERERVQALNNCR